MSLRPLTSTGEPTSTTQHPGDKPAEPAEPAEPADVPAGTVTAGRDDLATRLAPYDVPADLLRQATAHRSYCSEHASQPSNERLELLGDAVLGLVVTDYLYRSFPALPEGDLARVRAAVVSTLGLGPVAASLGLGDSVLLGRGEESSGGRHKASILVDCLEAVIGAVYLSAGFAGAQTFVNSLVAEEIGGIVNEARLGDPKNRLQELCAHLDRGQPSYLIAETGPDHAKRFRAEAIVAGHRLGSGEGRSKKDAERQAAMVALLSLTSADGDLEQFPLSGRRA